jgi:endonuclease YncB( thermonuclease family)
MIRALLAALLLAVALPASAQTLRVLHADTFILNGERVIIENIDAPKIDGACAAERRKAQDAKRELERMLRAGPIDLERMRRKDPSGGTLARVRVNGADVGLRLIVAKLAHSWSGQRDSWC